MKRMCVAVLFVGFAISAEARGTDTTTLVPKGVYGREARVISSILDNNHYRKIALNDSLSSVILNRYLSELDNNKTYFLQSDVKTFEKYRFALVTHVPE